MPRPQRSLAESTRRIRAGLSLRDRDPLSFWKHASEATRKATAALAGFIEVYLRSGNKAGKTEWGAAVVLAIMQRRLVLDGVTLPRFNRKLRLKGVVFSLDYEQQKLSVQPTYLRLLGEWPHRARYKRDGILSTLLVKPIGGSDDEATWSVIHFLSQANLKSGTGARGVHVAHADEPPVEPIWREMRKGAHAGHRMVRIITATPLVRRQWWWLSQEFPKAHEGQVHHGRLEMRLRALYPTTVAGEDFMSSNPLDYASENAALTRDDIQQMLWDFENDPLRKARWLGEYVDASADNPLDVETLMKMARPVVEGGWVREPEVLEWRISREVEGEAGLVVVLEKVQIEVFGQIAPGKTAYLCVDPSKGIKSDKHDPGGILVCENGTGNLLAVYEGYIGSYGLGVLAAGLARQYGNARVDFENNGGWGLGVARGLSDAGYGNVAKMRKELEPGKWEVKLGWATTAETRPGFFAASQAWLAAYKAGAPYAICPSMRVLDALMDLVIGDNDKPVARPGTHDEFAILWGRQLTQTSRRRSDPNLVRATTLRRPDPRPLYDGPTLEQLVAGAIAEDRGGFVPGGGRQLGGKIRRRPT